ncbi:hypothetical protein NFI96_014796, partial [Prochilodus magdalenae]
VKLETYSLKELDLSKNDLRDSGVELLSDEQTVDLIETEVLMKFSATLSDLVHTHIPIRNVPLTWTNQITAQTSASKTLTITSPPAPVSEMERSRVALITLMCVLISSISGLVVEIRVKPGDNVTIYCDRTQQGKLKIVWIIKPSNEQQPPLIHLTEDTTPPHYSRVWNYSKGTYDLLVKNITESDLGLYYCALHEIKFTRGSNGERVREDVYHEGNRTTFLSFLGESVHSDLLVLLIWVSFKTDGTAERQGNMEMRNHNECTSMLREDQGVSKGHSTMGNWLTLSGVLIYSISGIIVEMRVKPGDNATIYCDCTQLGKFFIAWFRKPSNEHQPPLIHLTKESTPPHYSRVWNKSEGTFDLLVENITESDLGLYYCALHEMKFTRGRNGERVREDVYHEGNRTTFLSFLDMTSTPSDCRIYWKLLVSVCPVFALLSSVVSSTCVHCICRRRSKVKQSESAVRSCETTRNPASTKHDKVGGDDVYYASLDLPGRGERRLKKKRVECSEFSTYSEVKTDQI